MKTLHTGELYAIDRRAPLDVQIKTMLKKFKLKHGCEPLQISWNPGRYHDKEAKDAPPLDKSVTPGFVWMVLK